MKPKYHVPVHKSDSSFPVRDGPAALFRHWAHLRPTSSDPLTDANALRSSLELALKCAYGRPDPAVRPPPLSPCRAIIESNPVPQRP